MSDLGKFAQDLQQILEDRNRRKTSPYDTTATVVRVDDDNIWVHISGGIDETPIRKTISASPGDNILVHIENGGAWATGNATSPPTDDTTANMALDAVNSLDERVVSAGNRLTLVEGNITGLETRVDVAEGDITTIEGDISSLDTRVNTAESSVTNLTTRIGTAEGKLSEAESDISALQQDVSDAQEDINDTLTGLALAENVIGTLAWLTAHSKETTDTTPVEGKSYYIRHQDGTFELVQDTTGKNPQQEHWVEMDSAISNYVGAHLSLTDYGLNLKLDNSSYRIHIGTLTASGDDGIYLLDGNGNVVTFFGENIDFSSTRVQHIGNNNAYIIFNPADGGSISIGGASITLGDTRTLDEVVAQVDNTLVYDHTYEYVVTGGKKTGAIFTAFLYRGGVDVKTEYDPTCFSWVLKKEDEDGVHKETSLGTGYTKTVSLADCGYGAEIIGRCEINDDPELLTIDNSNLQDISNNNLSVRAQGESVRVRDLTTSSIIFPNESIMVVGASNEHLVTIQTLQDYLNANLDKQVLFNTTDGWDVQLRPQSEPNTLYIYTDHQIDSQGNKIAGIKVGDGNAYVCDLPFIDAICTEHMANTTIHVTASDRTRWDEKVRCYYAGTEQLIFTTT